MFTLKTDIDAFECQLLTHVQIMFYMFSLFSYQPYLSLPGILCVGTRIIFCSNPGAGIAAEDKGLHDWKIHYY